MRKTYDETCLERSVVERGLEDLAAHVVEETGSVSVPTYKALLEYKNSHVDGPLLLENLPSARRLVVEDDIGT